jgi:hypothetical protein
MKNALLVLLLSLVLASAWVNAASATGTFVLDPQHGSSALSTDLVVNLNFTTDVGFKSCNADLTIDSTIVNITTGDLSGPGTSPAFSLENWGYMQPAGAPNTYRIAFVDFGAGAPAGTYCLAKLTFSPVAAGVSGINFSGLACTDQNGTTDTCTATNGTFTVTVPGPTILSFAPSSPVTNYRGENRTFNITLDQPVNVTWKINGSVVKDMEHDVTEAEYTNASAVPGLWNVTATAENANGTTMQTWLWYVNEPEAIPTAALFGVENASGRSGTQVEVPVTITNVMNGSIMGIRFRVEYNTSVLNLTNVTWGDLTSTWTHLQLGTDRRTIFVGTAHAADGLPDTSTGSIAVLNFTVLGAPGETSPMNFVLIELANSNGVVGTAPAKNGTFFVAQLGSITGRITCACNGTGIAGVMVNVSLNGAVVNSTVTNATGHYHFDGLEPDEYTLSVSKPRFYANATDVTVIAGGETTGDLTLWLKGDLNNDCTQADAGDVVLMLQASVGDIAGDFRYDLNENELLADAGDVVLILRASVGDLELV